MPKKLMTHEEHLNVKYYTRPDSYPGYAGIPLGGLGTGSIELCADGSLRQWQIFNNLGNNQTIGFWEHWPSFDLAGAFLAVRVECPDHRVVAKVLEKNPVFNLPGIKKVGFSGQYPCCYLHYGQLGIPSHQVKVK